ncbi:putative Ras-like protein family member 10B [Hypsibius exemplaris]|uniref:Ras-like protein family member 10B n=1 Tax=Hypsibius exemplaris TaxID=2072580 RepID=A0A1W0WC53_HYPEX|nr:putative Ras-like protein family member 10B [Hypsibius exemplaris]
MPTTADLRAFVREATTSSSSTDGATSLTADCNGQIHSETVKIVVLGAACAGKTSVIKQFVGNGQEFSDHYDPTERKSSHFKTVLTFDTNTQKITHWALKIVDVPVTDVPIAAVMSWSNFLQFDVANAAAYVIMFDVSAQFHSFDFVRTIREQLVNHPSTSGGLIFIAGNKVDLPYQLNRSDIMHVVQKQWKCQYFECSSKKNFHIVGLFQAIIEAVQAKQSAAARAKAHHSEFHGFRRTFKSDKCCIQ